MKTIYCNEALPPIEKCVVSVGNFDGVHAGHRHLIEQLCARSRILNVPSVLITFEPHTRAFLFPDRTPPRLTTFDEKALILRSAGLEYLACMPFDADMAALTPEQFIDTVLIRRFHAIEWVMGENHHFGKNGAGTYNFLHNSPARNHFNMFRVTLHREEGTVASSSIIRSLINEHRIDEAVRLLGHAYPIIAERIRGMRKGFELGYPTLNFKCPPTDKVIPPPGVYAAQTAFGNVTLSGALYYGNCPTFENRDYHFEFHSLDAVEYDPGIHTEAALWLHSYLRADRAFASESALIAQITRDISYIKKIFSKE